MKNEINTEPKTGSNLIQVSNNNAKYYEQLSEENAKKTAKNVQECASYIGVIQKIYADCKNVKKELDDSIDDKIHVHVEDFNNPHNVTTSQIGTYSKNEIDKQIQEHSKKNNNPHNVTATQIGTYSSNEIDTILSKNYSYITQNTDNTEWSRIYYSDKEKTSIKWIEQGGFKSYTSSIAAGKAVNVSVTLPISYGKGLYTRMASSVNDGIYCFVDIANESDNGTTLNVHLRNITSKSITPSGFWWQTTGTFTQSDSGYDGGKDLPDIEF